MRTTLSSPFPGGKRVRCSGLETPNELDAITIFQKPRRAVKTNLSLCAVASLFELQNQTLVLMGIDFIGLLEIDEDDKVNRRPVSQLFAIFYVHHARKKD
jgi:hypothetical protein